MCGHSLARQQLALALAFGCQRVIAITTGVGPELFALQHEAERGGAKFHAVTGINGVIALLSKGDQLVAFADGLLLDAKRALDMLAGGPVVVVQPAEAGQAAGFERIDAATASAGLMCLPADMFAGNVELPADCDVFSTLQRIALQAGVRRAALALEDETGRPWTLIRSDSEAHAAEQQWLGRVQPVAKPLTLERLLNTWSFRAFASALLHAGNSAILLIWAALALASIALVTGWFGYACLALALWTLGWIAHLTAQSLSHFTQQVLLQAPQFQHELLLPALFDAILVMLIIVIIPADIHLTMWLKAYFSLVLLGLIRLVPRLFGFGMAAWLQDRVILALMLMLVSLLGNLAVVIPIVSLCLIAGALVQVIYTPLTRA